ncbi:MAG: hypothetical protein L3J09_09675 [Flavobacteriaceae bacterium]|nr:hypothetical protein [Flavobacteriaceae bacterium]
MKKKFPLALIFIAVLLFFSACIKDTDFNQTDAIEITPIIELDFLFSNITSQTFTDIGINNLVLSDTTNFNFLNDEFTVDNLERAEFYFKNTNSMPVDFEMKFQFLDDNNEEHYLISIPIISGELNNPVISEHIENIETDGIISLTMANKVVLSIEASSSVDNLEGTLKLQSKTTYYLKIIQ